MLSARSRRVRPLVSALDEKSNCLFTKSIDITYNLNEADVELRPTLKNLKINPLFKGLLVL